MTKKIIGYKTPTSLWGGQIPKGAFYVKSVGKNYGWIEDLDEDGFNIPSEIVETWEPVYEENKSKFKVGDIVVVLNNKIGDGCNSPNFYKVGLVGKIDKIYGESNSYKGQFWVHIAGEPHDNGIIDGNLRLATESEIKDYEINLLLEEAKEKYPKGTLFLNKKGIKKESNGYFTLKDDGIITKNNYVYFRGTWSTRAEDEYIEIQGYRAEFNSEFVKFGCQKYKKSFVNTLFDLLEKNAFTIYDNKGNEITAQIKAVNEKLNK